MAIGLIVALATGSAEAAPPDWLRAAAAAPGGAATAPATVLLDDQVVTVSGNGRVSTVRRYAVRIHQLDGRSAAMLREVYVTGSDKIRNLRGWLLRADGGQRELGDAAVVDVALVDNDVYNEARARVLTGAADVAAGDVFGAEVETDGALLFAQVEWQLQARWPVQISRRTLTLPAGWRARSVTFNAAPIDNRSQGASLVWEARDLAEIPDEPDMPAASDLVPRLAVSFFAPSGQAAPGQFESWNDVAGWVDRLTGPRAASTPAIVAKARELTAGAATDFDRISAIGRFAQRVQYVSIQTGLGRGGGYQPRAAEEVLNRNYGDCKDKATLMRAMLGAIGMRSHLVLVYSGDRNYVRSEWASPQQFNHAIVAVVVPSGVDHPGVIGESRLGRLLFFDPTDQFTPVGLLPLHEQGSHALVVDAAAGWLVKLPLAPESDHRVVRTVEGRISNGGAFEASVVERSTGDRAAQRRAVAAALDPSTYRMMTERRVAAVVQGGRVVGLSPEAAAGSEFVQRMTIAADRYAQPMGGLLLIKLPFELGDEITPPSAGARRAPVAIEPRLVEETVRVALPAAFTVDEAPPDTSIETPFGHYSLKYSVEPGGLVARRTMLVRGATIPKTDAAALNSFYERIRTADSTPVVLAKQ